LEERNDITVDIIEAKLLIGNILDLICDYRLDKRLTKLLVLFKSRMDTLELAATSTQAKEKQLADSKIEFESFLRSSLESDVFSFLSFEDREFLPLVTSLLGHSHNDLSTIAAKLMLRHFRYEISLFEGIEVKFTSSGPSQPKSGDFECH